MEKKISSVFSYVFHPLLMTFFGLLIIFNSGTGLSVLQVEVKRFSLIIVGLFTLIFPSLLIIVLYFTRVIKDPGLIVNRDRLLTLSLIFVFYLFTFFMMRSIPQLTYGHKLFLACAPSILIVSMLIDTFLKNSLHLAGIGMILAILLVLVVFLGAALEFIFICAILAGGILGTSRMLLQLEKPAELLAGFGVGFLVTFLILSIYVL